MNIRTSCVCCRCGTEIQAPPSHTIFQCPKCKSHMENTGGMWLEYVSPLDPRLILPQEVPFRRVNGSR
jgi:tRNA(Ile2) C34 agmatinyltransferase TiaS